MKRYFIVDAKRDEVNTDQSTVVVASVKFLNEGKPQWLNWVDADGITGLILSERDIFDELLENCKDNDDSAIIEYLDENAISKFEGIDFEESYDTPYDSIYRFDPENPANPLIRFLFSLSLCPMEQTDNLIVLAKEKYIDEVEIPMNDAEKCYLDAKNVLDALTEEDIEFNNIP